jgi:micrococcal nuclease
MIYEYRATLSRVVDGDTIYLNVQLGFKLTMEVEFRLLGLNTPEVVGPQKVAGLAAKAELERLLRSGPLRVVSDKSEKYGRWLATIYVKQPDGSELNVNDALLTGGFAKIYSGTGVKPV